MDVNMTARFQSSVVSFADGSDRRSNGKWFVTGLAVALALAGQSAAQVSNLVEANTGFALDLHQRVKGHDASGNVCYSPYSVSAALAMTYAGARGTTATQMAHALHFDALPDTPHQAFGELDNHLQQVEAQGDVRLSVANGIWAQQGRPFLPAFIQTLTDNYRGAYHTADFMQDPDGERVRINAWVEQATYDKIRNLIPAGSITPEIRLVLANAIYFKGPWARPFWHELTSNEAFRVSGGPVKSVPTMHQTDRFLYCADATKQVLALQYLGEAIAMIVILPTATDGLEAVETGLNADGLRDCLARLAPTNVAVALPKFRIESSFDLSETLAAMGMRDAFTEQADFSGMDGLRDLFIAFVAHKAFVQVDEKGTEAAAATAVGMTATALPPQPIEFRADHPFLFLIRDNGTGAILFAGRVADPPSAPAYTGVNAAHDYFLNAYPLVADWVYSDWFGVLWAQSFPWLWSVDQGWLYCYGQGGDRFWLWFPQRGWLFGAPSIYPFFWSASGNRWQWHYRAGDRNTFTPY
jgi:serpin B